MSGLTFCDECPDEDGCWFDGACALETERHNAEIVARAERLASEAEIEAARKPPEADG